MKIDGKDFGRREKKTREWLIDVASELAPDDESLFTMLARHADLAADYGQAHRARRFASRARQQGERDFDVDGGLADLIT